MTAALSMLRDELGARGFSIIAACEACGVSRQSFYGLARPGGGSNLGPDQLGRLCDLAELDDDHRMIVLVAWLKKRFEVGAASGPLGVAFRIIDDMPKKRRRQIYGEMLDSYEERRGSKRNRP